MLTYQIGPHTSTSTTSILDPRVVVVDVPNGGLRMYNVPLNKQQSKLLQDNRLDNKLDNKLDKVHNNNTGALENRSGETIGTMQITIPGRADGITHTGRDLSLRALLLEV